MGRSIGSRVKISVFVKPNSKIESVDMQEDGSYIVRVNVPPVDGKANDRTIELLAKFFKLSKSSVTLINGHKGKKKVFEIP